MVSNKLVKKICTTAQRVVSFRNLSWPPKNKNIQEQIFITRLDLCLVLKISRDDSAHYNGCEISSQAEP